MVLENHHLQLEILTLRLSVAFLAESMVRSGKVQTLDWTTGMEYWTDIFSVFAHVVVG